VRGTVSMNHPEGRPEGAGSQFFICVKDTPAIDLPGEKYTIFGKVVEGLDVVDAIASVETDPKTNRPLKAVTIERIAIGAK
jgi:cyclophilin family peptidyl-prolyl cis-trans isomerase